MHTFPVKAFRRFNEPRARAKRISALFASFAAALAVLSAPVTWAQEKVTLRVASFFPSQNFFPNGARVTMIDLNAAQLDVAVKRLRDGGARVFGSVADVTQIETLRAAIDATIEREKRIDVVFANAGISAGPGFLAGDGSRNPAAAFENLSLEILDRAVATNLGGHSALSRLSSRT